MNDSPPTRPRRRLPLRRKLLFAAILLGAFVLLLEGAFRLSKSALGIEPRALQRVRAFVSGNGEGPMEPDAHTSYRLNRKRPDVNSLGFRDDEFVIEKPPGLLRIACLGGSTTYGHAVERNDQTYPAQLELMLNQRLAVPVDVQNWGVPSWTTAETMVNYFLNVQDFHADIVIVHHAMNDVEPRLRPGFQNDYSHYRSGRQSVSVAVNPFLSFAIRISDLAAYGASRMLAKWSAQGINTRVEQWRNEVPLDPATTYPFRRNILTICEHVATHGGHPVLMTMAMREKIDEWVNLAAGCREHNQILRDLAAEHGYALIDLEKDWAARRSEFDPLFKDPVHLTAKGCRRKAQWIADRLDELGLLGASGAR